MSQTKRRSPQAGTRYYPTMHALTATQAVLGPLLGQRRVQFPPDRLTVAILREFWHQRAQQLARAGYLPLQRRGALDRALACPHALLAPDTGAKDRQPCHIDRVCPFCHALRAALTFENVWRVVERHPNAAIYFCWREHCLPAALPGECGRLSRRGSALVALNPSDHRGLLPFEARPVPRSPLGVSVAVAWLCRYPVMALMNPAPAALAALDRIKGKHLSHTRGIFRSPLSAIQIGQCRTNLIAPTRSVEEERPGSRLHEADGLASCLPASFDHEAYVRAQLSQIRKDASHRLVYGGELPPALSDAFFRPEKSYKDLLKVWSPGDDGVLVASAPGGYAVLHAG